MIIKKTKVTNAKGIHVRPSTIIAAAIAGYGGKILVHCKDGCKECIGASPLSVISLGLKCGDEISIQVSGEDEERICDMLCGLFSKKYDFK